MMGDEDLIQEIHDFPTIHQAVGSVVGQAAAAAVHSIVVIQAGGDMEETIRTEVSAIDQETTLEVQEAMVAQVVEMVVDLDLTDQASVMAATTSVEVVMLEDLAVIALDQDHHVAVSKMVAIVA